MILILVIGVALGKDCKSFCSETPYAGVPDDLSEDCLLGISDFACLDYLVDKALEEKINLLNLKKRLEEEKRWVSKTIQLLNINPEPQMVKPSIRWAQSLNQVFVDIKFSHRIDSAGCSELYYKDVVLTSNGLDFTGKCIHSNHKLVFNLHLDFFDLVVPDQSKVNQDLVGRIELQLEKNTAPSLWEQLYDTSKEKPQGLSVWWDMQNFYNDEIEEFTDVAASL